MTAITDELAKIPLFSDLAAEELVHIEAFFSVTAIAAGETLYAEGDPAKSACFLIDGEFEAYTALPGGGEALVGTLGPGSMIGEMALMAGGRRTATVRATKDSSALTVSYTFFQAALDQFNPSAFKILRRITMTLSDRLNGLQQKLVAHWNAEGSRPARTPDVDGPAKGAGQNGPSSFEYRAFLPLLSCFRDFEPHEIDALLARAGIVELPRGQLLYREGDAAQAGYIVARGAVELSVTRKHHHQLAILGPGRLCGTNAMISGRGYHADATVCSGALLLELDTNAFDELFNGDSAEAFRFQRAVGASQLMELKAADNLLTTLVSQAHVRDAPRLRAG